MTEKQLQIFKKISNGDHFKITPKILSALLTESYYEGISYGFGDASGVAQWYFDEELVEEYKKDDQKKILNQLEKLV